MIWLILLDILIFNFTSYSTYFFLLLPIFYKKQEYIIIIFAGLFIDVILLNIPFLNTIILLILFFLNKKIIKLKKKTLMNFLLVANFNFAIYHLIMSFFYNFNIINFAESFFLNFMFCLLSYNLLGKYIKLAR